MNHIGNDYLNHSNIATAMLNPTPWLTENCIWIPEVSDNVVPGLDRMLSYTQSNCATLTSLQHTITNIYVYIYIYI